MKNIPFYSNYDNTHCFQAVIKMILKYYFPEEKYPWKKLEQFTGKKEGLWTWPLYGLLRLKEKGFNIIIMEHFDYYKFVQFGNAYLLERFGEEVGKAQIQNSDIPFEVNNARLFLQYFKENLQIPSLDDIKKLLEDDYLVIANVNSSALNNKKGYNGHFVLIYAFDEKYFYMHDPGLPFIEARKVSYDIFNLAWAYPSEQDSNLIALKYKSTTI